MQKMVVSSGGTSEKTAPDHKPGTAICFAFGTQKVF